MAAGRTSFVPNRRADRELAMGAPMRAYLEAVAGDAASNVDRRAPRWIKRSHGRFDGVSVLTRLGHEGRVVVHSPFWHLAEYASGATRTSPTPFIRPGVQATISRVGGRWKST